MNPLTRKRRQERENVSNKTSSSFLPLFWRAAAGIRKEARNNKASFECPRVTLRKMHPLFWYIRPLGLSGQASVSNRPRFSSDIHRGNRSTKAFFPQLSNSHPHKTSKLFPPSCNSKEKHINNEGKKKKNEGKKYLNCCLEVSSPLQSALASRKVLCNFQWFFDVHAWSGEKVILELP